MTIGRSHLSKSVIRKVSGAPSGGTCTVYADTPEGNITTPYAGPLYTSADPTNNLTLTNPFSFVQGQLDFYTVSPIRVNLVVVPTAIAPATTSNPVTFLAVDLWPSPNSIVVSDEGLLADRPDPTIPWFRYYATDTGVEYVADGTSWRVANQITGYENSFLLMGA